MQFLLIAVTFLFFSLPWTPSFYVNINKQILGEIYSETSLDFIRNSNMKLPKSMLTKTQLSFAAFADTHIGVRYQYPQHRTADHLDKLGNDLVNSTSLLDFAIHLRD